MSLKQTLGRRRFARAKADLGCPFLTYSLRNMPVRGAAWRVGWWLILRVTLRGHTGWQRSAMIHDALGCYRFDRVAARAGLVSPVSPVQTTSASTTTNVVWRAT